MGKRSYHFEIYDALFLILALFFLIGGIVNNDVSNSLVMVALTLSYVPVSNIIVNRRLADCAVNALIVSSVPITIAALIEYIISLSGDAGFIAKAVFVNNDTYSAFLILALAFTFCFAKEKKNIFKKAAYYAIAVLHFVNIILAWHVGLWLSTFILIFAYLIIRTKKHRKELLLALIILPYFLFLLPETFFAKITELFSLSPAPNELIASFKSGLEIFSDNLMFGVGFGPETPRGNMALSIAMNYGVIVLSIFFIIFVLRLVQLSEYHLSPDHDYPEFCYRKGFSYLDGFYLEVHYTGEEAQRAAIRRVLAERGKTVYALLPMRGALIAEDGCVRCLGDVVCFGTEEK